MDCIIIANVVNVTDILWELGYPEQCHNHCFHFDCFGLNFIVLGYFKRSSSITKNGWVKIRLHTKNQLPRLPGTALIVITSVVV